MPRFTTTAVRTNLREVMAFVEQALGELGVAGSDAFAVRLAVEEVCTNIMSYGYEGREAGPLSVELGVDPPRCVVSIRDHGAPFAPDDAPAPDLTSEAETRRIGGLGVHLVQQMMDEVTYTADAVAGNTLRMVKKLT